MPAMPVTSDVNNGSICAEMHKSSGSAVSGGDHDEQPQATHDDWYVAQLTHQRYTRHCCDFVAAMRQERPLECYVPSRREMHVYPNRTKRKVERFVIPSVVFVSGLTEREAYQLAPACPYIDYLMPDRARNRVDGHLALARIPHRDILRLQKAIADVYSADDIEFTTENLQFDEQIVVAHGSLKGMEGGYCHDVKSDFLVLAVGRLGNIKVKVRIEDCVLKKIIR